MGWGLFVVCGRCTTRVVMAKQQTSMAWHLTLSLSPSSLLWAGCYGHCRESGGLCLDRPVACGVGTGSSLGRSSGWAGSLPCRPGLPARLPPRIKRQAGSRSRTRDERRRLETIRTHSSRSNLGILELTPTAPAFQ